MYSCGMFFSGAKYEQDFLMGDLNKQTFKEIIESDRYWNIVDKVKMRLMYIKNVMQIAELIHVIIFYGCKRGPINDSIKRKHGGSYIEKGITST